MTQPILQPGIEISRYRIEQLVARGGMGLVYRARDVRLDRPVALKVLSPELSDDERFRERFVRESRLAAAVDHPHVIPVYEADEWQGLLYIAMRFVEGVDLHSVLATSGPLPPATAMAILRQAADALDAAHGIGLVHRDVKPGNFMLAGARAGFVPPSTHVYLTDFGLTKRATSVSGLTRTGQFLGSLHYVAPEQIRAEEVDPRTDVYALACVAYEMLAGAPPFPMNQDAALLWAHMSVPPPTLTDVRPDLPGELDDALASGLAKNRADRPASCGAFVNAVRGALATGPARAERPVSPSPGPGATAVVPPGTPVGTAPERPAAAGAGAAQQRAQTPVGPPAPPTWQGTSQIPPPAGPPPGQDAGSASGPPTVSGRRRAWWPLAVVGLVVALAVGLLVWRPWSGPDLVTRDLVVVPYQAGIPEEWQPFVETVDGTFTVFGTQDWGGLLNADSEVLAEAEAVAAEDPESLVQLYVDPSDYVSADTAADAAYQLQGILSYNARLVEQGTREVDGREGFQVTGVVQLTEDQQLRLYAVAVNEEPRLLLVFLCPSSLYEQWRPTFDAIVDSVRYTG